MKQQRFIQFQIVQILAIIVQPTQSFIPVNRIHRLGFLQARSQLQPQQRPMASQLNTTEENTGNFLLSKLDQLSTRGPKRLILASQSPRRREILDMMGLKERYTVNPSPLDEEKLQVKLSMMKMSPQEYTKKLAEEKANALARQMLSNEGADKGKDDDDENHEVTFILGSDTIVDFGGRILEKPKSQDNAIEMLRDLSGEWHEVHTGVALYRIDHKSDSKVKVHLATSYTETAKVKFGVLSMKDIEAYVGTGEPMDKAGSYGIQGIGGQFVEKMDGDFFTVMGLPMNSLSRAISEALASTP